MPAIIYDQFSKQIGDLQDTADNNSEANRELAQREWRVPPDWTTAPTDIPSLGDPFDRTDMNDAYPTFFDDPDSHAGDAAACKIQADHLGCQERAWRLQFSTGIRCGMHASARRKGHGDAADGSFARITDHLIDMIVAGSL